MQTHSPIDYPHVSEFGNAIMPNTETFISIQAAVTIADPDVQDIREVNSRY